MEENLKLAFEVSKLLAHNGYPEDAPAFAITWGQVAEAIAQSVLAHNLPTEPLTGDTVLTLPGAIQADLAGLNIFPWPDVILDRVMTSPALNPALWDFGQEPDEGPLTEAYENATRLGDDESYWVDAGASADLFDDF
jgi:hypothetical protein